MVPSPSTPSTASGSKGLASGLVMHVLFEPKSEKKPSIGLGFYTDPMQHPMSCLVKVLFVLFGLFCLWSFTKSIPFSYLSASFPAARFSAGGARSGSRAAGQSRQRESRDGFGSTGSQSRHGQRESSRVFFFFFFFFFQL